MKKQYDLDNVFKRFHQNLQIPSGDGSILKEARQIIRSHLRRKFTGIKFMTQGSYTYHTLIRPCHTPPQRMDLDDGAYFFGITLTEENAKQSSENLFYAVDQLLAELSFQKGWQLDTSKPTCSRVILSIDKHIDIPCYRVINGQLSEETYFSHRSNYYSLYKEANIPYHDLAESEFILLAHRKEGWIKSDPRLIIDWVLRCTEKYGRQFLRVCCYFKAWRDNQWKKSSMKSLLVMAMVERAFGDLGITGGKIEDDIALFRTSGLMIDYLEDGGCIKDPSDDSQCLDENLSLEERNKIIEKLKSLYKDTEIALFDSSVNTRKVSESMCGQFGRWFPKDSNLIIPLAVTPTIISQPTQVKAHRPWSK